jgi:hypothetical protein
MIKRVPALLLVFLASIVLLANAVIPHHHHENEVCIESSHCESDGEEHHDGDAENNHDHDGASNFMNCALNQIYIIPSTLQKEELKSIDLLNPFHSFIGIPAIHTSQEKSNIATHYFDAPPIHQPPSFYILYVNHSRGLRAPPLV